jgi:hypothetical protein
MTFQNCLWHKDGKLWRSAVVANTSFPNIETLRKKFHQLVKRNRKTLGAGQVIMVSTQIADSSATTRSGANGRGGQLNLEL